MLRDQRGNSLLETTWALFLCLIIMLAAVTFIANSFRGAHHTKDKTFAVQKAIAILEELKGVVEQKGGGGSVVLLDNYDDGAAFNPILTTTTGITDPAAAASGNLPSGGAWRYYRQVSVTRLPNATDNSVRLVNVRLFARETAGEKMTELADVGGLVRTIADRYPPTQVYDVYAIAVSQVPGWWVYLANLVPFVQQAVNDLEARNPGLEFRTHWITNLAYGRDLEYKPFINSANASTSDINWVYFYPGKLPTGSAVDRYYVPTQFKAEVSIDGTVTNGYDASSNPLSYAVADQYNNAMRYDDELSLFNQRKAAGLETEPTYRLLLDDMVLNPSKYMNAILINLHGELIPLPPVRNYSDAAKDPGTTLPNDMRNIRAVAHPERLRFNTTGLSTGSMPHLRVRVYSYLADPASSTLPTPDIMYNGVPITVFFPNVDVSSASVYVMPGGVDADGTSGVDRYPNTWLAAPTTASAQRMYYTVQFDSARGTIFRLYNSPLKTPSLTQSASAGYNACGSSSPAGLPTTYRLYGMDYVPTPFSADFSSRPLGACGAQPKNTARWVIDVPDSELVRNTKYAIETRLGDVTVSDPVSSWPGSRGNHPPNLSRTYAWYGDDTWAWGDASTSPAIPPTEWFQYQGDPRHNPYADLIASFNSTSNPVGGGYNRYFNNMNNGSHTATSSDYPMFSELSLGDGWTGANAVEVDVNRFFQLVRGSLLKTQSIWTTMTGFSYYYFGFGDEIGYDDANGFPNSIPVSTKPFSGSSGSGYEQSIIDGGVKIVRENTNNGWWSKAWLGDLYPDDKYATYWAPYGNLPTGTGSGRYIRTQRGNITWNLPWGTSFFNTEHRLWERGCTAFFQIGSTSSTFHHNSTDGQTGSLTTDGNEIASSYRFPIPSSATISRPFGTTINNTGANPDGFLDTHYYYGRLAATALATYFNHQSGSSVKGSQLLMLKGTPTVASGTTAPVDQAYIVVNGLDRTVSNGSAFISRWSFLTLIHSFLRAGVPGVTGGNNPVVRQVPQIRISTPNDLTDIPSTATSVTINWGLNWKRWDGQKYTSQYSDSFVDSNGVYYALIYSGDGGSTWRYVQDGSAATPGRAPDSTHRVESSDTTISHDWDISGLAQGSYLLRVEAYRSNMSLHYGYHMQKIFVKR